MRRFLAAAAAAFTLLAIPQAWAATATDPDDVCMNGRDGGSGDYLDGGTGSDGYNTDPGDKRINFEYTSDPSLCNGWTQHGNH